MTATLLVIHILLAVCLIIAVLVQRTSADGGGLMGGSSSSMGGLMTVRGTANLLTRITAILATCFIATSILLTILAGSHTRAAKSITEQIAPVPAQEKTDGAPAAPQQSVPAVPAAPATPAVPLSQ